MPVSRISFDSSPSGTPVGVISPSSTRVRLTIFAPVTGIVTVSQDPGVQIGQGVNLALGSAPIELDVAKNGDMVRGAFYVVYSGVIAPIAWIETFP